MPLVTKSMKNPRSALCKTAIMVSADIFKAYHEHLLDTLDPLVLACFNTCFLELMRMLMNIFSLALFLCSVTY